MNFFDIYPLALAIIFVFLLGWLMPKSGKTYDVLTLHFDLFPRWFKWLGRCCLLVSVVVAVILFQKKLPWNYFLLSNVNFSMFILFFSKEKNEDEFSEQVRLKAFVYSFVSFVAVLIIYGALQGSNLVKPVIFGESVFVLIFLGVALVTALVYFNITIYKFDKKSIEK